MSEETLQALRGRMQELVGSQLQALTARSAALTIAMMDPHVRDDLVCYLNDLSKAQQADDGEEQEYLTEAIEEILLHPNGDAIANAPSLDDVEAKLLTSPEAQRTKRDLDEQTAEFLKRYRALKERAGLATQAEVAERAGVSPTTIQAIESGRVWPQFRTLQKLAKAFGVSVNRLWPG